MSGQVAVYWQVEPVVSKVSDAMFEATGESGGVPDRVGLSAPSSMCAIYCATVMP